RRARPRPPPGRTTRREGRGAACSGLEAVAHAPHRLQVGGVTGVGLELLAEAADVHGDRGAVGDLETPDVVEELLAGEDLARVPGEERQQVELERGQSERNTPGLGLAGAGIDRDVA